MDSALQASIQEWLRLDKNDATINEIKDLVARTDIYELEKRMRKRIEFGTAGLRGKMEAGWSRMNDLTVIQASQGLCAYVSSTIPDAVKRGIVIGHDHRHNSQRWATLVSMVFLNNGFKVYLYRKLVHTPLVPFGIKKLGAACGVMITASHNPKQDNGYKVYWSNAVQIISPHDSEIAKAIEENLEPKSWDTNVVNESTLGTDVTEAIENSYFESLTQLCQTPTENGISDVLFVNTSMHGVGHPFARRAFQTFNLQPFHAVELQQEPDPEFSTVSFPNPEEKGALDLAIKKADEIGAKYILAQDPDADRFSAAEKNSNGEWTIFTGDQLGTIFAANCFQRYLASGKPIEKLAMVASTVSSKMIEAIAEKEGFKFVETLTGFKYIGNKALELCDEGFEVPFGYEEAIGFMLNSDIRDKDGVSAAAFFAEIAVNLAKNNSSVAIQLKELYSKYGYFETANSYFLCEDPVTINKIFAKLRSYDKGIPERQGNYPKSIAGLEVTSVKDLTVGYDSTNPPTFKPNLPLSSGHMIQFKATSKSDDTRINLTIRTSGTEPKIKFYLEGCGKNSSAVRSILPDVVKELRDTWMDAKENGLKSP
ncbi:phosphoglucomutase 1 [Pyrrhoderma noxium]|uniref:Phosphoglucomutase 1 n=1 Tax=Pyrrhoderma noxium TaxID=2282107 RepID=A0A286UVE9_9AGAM|nr:phosphoglucomutase 1 [Pyrrhoderma noxium]